MQPEEQPIQFFNPEPRGFALWRMPDSSKFFFTAGAWEGKQELKNEDLENPGFIFHPFDTGSSDIFILKKNLGILSLEADDIKDLSKKGMTSVSVPDFPHQFNWMSNEEREESFKSLVQKAIDQISSGPFQKIVASRAEIEESNKNPWDVFLFLAEKHKNAFISFVSIENLGQWIGATPELICRAEKGGVIKTVSLAGTSKDGQFTQKEKEEQQLVTEFIENAFREFGVKSFDRKENRQIQVGEINHLETRFETRIDSGVEPLDILKRLHPTPAVGGLPQKESMSFIIENENHPRSYYSGFIGPFVSDQIFSFFVNLRCMQVFKDKAVLYAGAGITKDSDPDKELIETRLKLKSLKDALE